MSSPLQDVYEAFWDMLEDSTDFTTLVKSGNRIKYHDTSPRERDVAAGADFPLVSVMPSSIKWNAFSDSHGTGAEVEWVIRVSTGERGIEDFFDVHWAVVRALSNWQTRMNALVWNSKTFVKSCRALKTAQTLESKADNRGTRGWTDVWAGEMQLWFDTTDLQTL